MTISNVEEVFLETENRTRSRVNTGLTVARSK